MLRREGFVDNYKRVERIYGQAGLQITRRPRKKLPARVRVPLELPTLPNQFWSMDFFFGRSDEQQKISMPQYRR